MKIGVISDTHGRFDEAIPSILDGVDAIIYAGDIGKLEIITRLQKIAPVYAVEGNNDSFGIFPIDRLEQFAGQRVFVRHIFGELHQLRQSDKRLIAEVQPQIVVFGHSHRPYQQKLGTTMLFNPGSAGPRRFTLPRTLGLLFLKKSGVEAQIIDLDPASK